MKYDEFAFFNQQLANMLRDGIPLEGALKQLSRNMGGGRLRRELWLLEADLSKGTPLKEALELRHLPELYKRMVQVGVKGNNLPKVLLMLADYYHKVNDVWIRLKGLMVYPVIVLFVSLCLSVFFVFFFVMLPAELLRDIGLNGSTFTTHMYSCWLKLLLPPVFLAVALAALLCAISNSQVRNRLRWHLPAFKEATLAQTASAMSIMLRGGCSFDEAAGVLSRMNEGSRAGDELAQWKARISEGGRKFSEVALAGVVVPPLFVWLVESAGEDLAAGFDKASDIYGSRARHKTEMLLYGALPVSVLALGLMLYIQASSFVSGFLSVVVSMSG